MNDNLKQQEEKTGIEKINSIFDSLSGSNWFENNLLYSLVKNEDTLYAAKALFREGYWACEKRQPAPTQQTAPNSDSVSNKRNLCTLEDLPAGSMFMHDGTIGLKSEYVADNRAIEAFIIGSGEMFWGGTSDPLIQRKIMVEPLTLIGF